MSCIKVNALQNDLSPSGSLSTENDNLSDIISQNRDLIISANKVFGRDWSHAVTNTTIDFNDYHSGKHHVGCQATVKVQLSKGIYHEDVGYSRVTDSSKGLAIEKARLISITNALIKVLSCFIEMESEMRKFMFNQNSVSNISNIAKTKFRSNRPITPPPPAQSTPKVSNSPAMFEGKRSKQIVATNDELIIPAVDLDRSFEKDDHLPASTIRNPTSNHLTSNSVAPIRTMTDEEIRLERKRKQREKQEEFKRLMKDKEEKDKQTYRRDMPRPNPKF